MPEERGTSIQRLGRRIARPVERWMPSPYLFALILTLVVYVAGIVVEGTGPFKMVQYWFGGFWNLLTFGMQMVLILVTGYVLAYHPRVRAIINWLCERPADGKQAVVLVGLISMVLAWINWGLGLIVGAIFAREMGRRFHEKGKSIHYPLVCVAGYLGLGLTWHWGLSASAPLLINTPGNIFADLLPGGVISTSKTIFSIYALGLTGTSIIFALVCLYFLAPPEEVSEGITEFVPEEELGTTEEKKEEEEEEEEELDPADKINQNRAIGGVIGIMGIIMAVYEFYTGGLDALNLNTVNWTFLMVGIAIYTAPKAYMDQFYDAVKSGAGIILQFPFYAGIMGMMASSGLAVTMATSLVAISTKATYPVVTWITGAIANIFVPSGGGEWSVIGRSIITASKDLGVPIGKSTIAYAVGDAHTNLFQPFWAIPLLGITGMRARDIFGYAITMLILLIPFLAIFLTVMPY